MCGVQGCKGKGWVFRMGLAARPVMPLRAVGSRADADDGKVVLESTSSACVVGHCTCVCVYTGGRWVGYLGADGDWYLGAHAGRARVCARARAGVCVCEAYTMCLSQGTRQAVSPVCHPRLPVWENPVGES